jgi:hypothetical protein
MRSMRRADHRMPPAECAALLERAEVLRLGLVDSDGPYVVPVNFGFDGERIWVHGPLEGRRIDAIAADPRVCFEADEGEIVRAARPCGFTSRFASVIGYGTARLLEGASEKRRGLDAIMRHYGSTGEGIPDEKLAITSVVEISIESLEGKWHGTDAGAGGSSG